MFKQHAIQMFGYTIFLWGVMYCEVPKFSLGLEVTVLHYKHNAAGNIASRKARLVAQAKGINYNETFSPTAKLSAIRIITTITTHNDWELEQTDIDGAYLNAP